MSPSPYLLLSASKVGGTRTYYPTRQDWRSPILYRSCANNHKECKHDGVTLQRRQSTSPGSKSPMFSSVGGVILTHGWVAVLSALTIYEHLYDNWKFYITFYLLGFIFTKQWEKVHMWAQVPLDTRTGVGRAFGAGVTGIYEPLVWMLGSELQSSRWSSKCS